MEKPNLDYINQLAGDDDVFKSKIIEIIKRELPEEIAVYQTLMQVQDYKAAAASVHKLKHKVSIFSLEKSYYLANEFEKNLNQNSTTIQADFEQILKSMQVFANSL